MKPLFVALALALAGPSAVAATVENHGTHPFNIRDLVMKEYAAQERQQYATSA